MIPAKITSLDPVQVEYWPNIHGKQWSLNVIRRTIADVENICNPCEPTGLCSILCKDGTYGFFDINKGNYIQNKPILNEITKIYN